MTFSCTFPAKSAAGAKQVTWDRPEALMIWACTIWSSKAHLAQAVVPFPIAPGNGAPSMARNTWVPPTRGPTEGYACLIFSSPWYTNS